MGSRAVLLVALALGWPATAGAQTAGAPGGPGEDGAPPETFVRESWTVEDGLPVNSINALLQSHDGYIWAATWDGLVRFDGVRFTVFNATNSEGLPSNRIIQLHESRDGSLWLRTEALQLVRFRNGVFTHFGPAKGLASEVWDVQEDADGTLWVGTESGLGTIRNERFVSVAPETIQGRVESVLQRRDGSIWAGVRSGGLFRVEGRRATAYAPLADVAAAGVVGLYEDAKETLWVQTHYAIWRYRDRPRRILEVRGVLGMRAAPQSGDLWVLTNSQVYRVDAQGAAPVLDPGRSVYTPELLVEDEQGRMLYTSGAELHRAGERIYTLPSGGGERSTDMEGITALAFDREGSLWVGTRGAGLHRLEPSLFTVYGETEGLSHRNAYSVYQDRAGAVWIGTLGGGASRLSNGEMTSFSGGPGFPSTVFSMLEDSAGRLWLGGSLEGALVCEPPAMRCRRPYASPIGNEPVRAIHEDDEGALWFGARSGLFRYHEGEWSGFSESDGAPGFQVRAFLPTRDGALWMATSGGGLSRYEDGSFRHVTSENGLPFDFVRSLHQDADGWLWVGTEGRGLARLDPGEWADPENSGRIVAYGTSDGLFDDVVHQILEDDFGRLWMSSNRGIFWLAREELIAFADGRIRRVHSTGYTERDGLRNREANGGSQPAGMKSRDGRLWFPTQNGVAVVDPADIQQNPLPPNVVIEQVAAGNDTTRPPADPLELGVEQRDLEIDYTALSFLAPANVQFRYRLEPYDDTWIEAGGRRTAYYTQVPPGRYTFRVAASNNNGVWNHDGASLELHLAPRFHETGAFRMLALLMGGLVVAGGAGWRMRSLRARSLELGRLVEERTAELRRNEEQLEAQNAQLASQAESLAGLHEARSRLFANLSHEFRTPLTLILGPLRGLLDGRHGPLPEGAREQHGLMLRNGQRLLRLINQILDLSSIQAGALTLDVRTADVVAFTRATVLAFAPLAERRAIELRFRANTSAILLDFDPEQLEKVLLNLLSNALKFTERGGEVQATVHGEGDRALIVVRDTGVGIASEELPRIFDRFHQADASDTRRHEGTGIGLALARELVELHGGEIRAESTPGEGSTFTVLLPVRRGPPEVGTTMSRSQPRGVRTELESEAAFEIASDDDAASAAARRVGEAAAASDDDSAVDRTTILVVDDNADVRAYVRSILEPAYVVIEARDGEEGLETARSALPDLIVADIMMPGLDGLGLGRALKSDPMTDAIPVVLLTARAAPEDQIAGLETGADAYLTKPFDPGVLEARVANLLAQRQILREAFRRGEADPPSSPAEPTSELDRRLRPLVEEHLTESDFGPDALAAAASLSYHQLYRALRDELGVTPSRFIRGVRADCASALLREEAGTITQVAYSVGFESLSYFRRAFRERYGTSPTEHLAAGSATKSAPDPAH